MKKKETAAAVAAGEKRKLKETEKGNWVNEWVSICMYVCICGMYAQSSTQWLKVWM